jgi:hypothetical protein
MNWAAGAAEPAGADDERVGGGEFLLRVDPELGQQDVAAVAEELRIVHRPSLHKRKRPAGPGASRQFDSDYSGFTCATALADTMTGWPSRWFIACVIWKSYAAANSKQGDRLGG